ncbi:hypothetical protein [Kitasatospora sp. NPDC059327]|uniref:hypothetical protein n=1 Tax=Kitasatospora sp. NPDC059327 TaxID=3346803 RepID=UPI0036BEFF9C
MEGASGLQQRDEPGQAGDVDLGPQDGGTVGDPAIVGAGVGDQFGDVGDIGEQRGGALVQRFEQLAGQGEFLYGRCDRCEEPWPCAVLRETRYRSAA